MIITILYIAAVGYMIFKGTDICKTQNSIIRITLWFCSLINDSMAYVVLPCFFLSLSKIYDANIVEYIIYWLGCALCFVTCLPTLIYSRNSIKSKDPFSVLDHPAEIIYLIAMNFYLLLKTRVFPEFESAVYFELFDLALILILLIYVY
jgi:hypothetical protein